MLTQSCRMSAVAAVLFSLCLISTSAGNPCCSFPCQNRGVCVTTPNGGYMCDCTGTDFIGQNCDTSASYFQSLKRMVMPSSETLHWLLVNFPWLWDFVNSVDVLRNFMMRKVILTRSNIVDAPPVYNSAHDYITMDVSTNRSYFVRALPGVPIDCPTPMGVAGPKVLPDAKLVAEKIFKRKQFKPDAMGTSILLAFFAQHFTHTFFKTDLKKGPGFTWGGDGVDASNIYGPDKHTEDLLRTFKDGKMKTQILNGEEWPPYVTQAPVKMIYPPTIPKDKQFALGHEFFGLLPGLIAYGTIWLREHNRVCEVLKKEQPHWNDEQLFQTAKLIIIGETINIVIWDYVQHLGNYNFKLFFDPELLFGESFQYSNRIAAEFDHLYHWHPFMPQTFNISGTDVPLNKFMYNTELPVKYGMKQLVESFSYSHAGEVTFQNHGEGTIGVAINTIIHGRELRFQSYNQYRKRFKLKPYSSFQELTGETEIAAELQSLYGEIDAVEFFVGIMIEKHRTKCMFGGGLIEIGGPFSVKGLMANPICSPKYWKPSTFGGEVGFNIVKTATLKKLFCANIAGDCPLVSFKVPSQAKGNCGSECGKNEL